MLLAPVFGISHNTTIKGIRQTAKNTYASNLSRKVVSPKSVSACDRRVPLRRESKHGFWRARLAKDGLRSCLSAFTDRRPSTDNDCRLSAWFGSVVASSSKTGPSFQQL